MSELIAIAAVIADRSYRIKIKPSDEEVVRKTLKTINDKIIEFKTMFAGKDMQDYISMVLIWYATQTVENSTSAPLVDAGLKETLQKLETQLDKLL